jgi:hypothetical protein
MKPQPGTQAHKAYTKGKEYAILNLPIRDYPYVTNRVIALKNWFEIGYNEEKRRIK